MKLKFRALLPALLVFASCTLPFRHADNQLTFVEKLAGWQLLFDGSTFAGWRGYRLPGPPAIGWEIKNGTLKTVPKVKGIELITERKFTDFEFSWEWRIAEAGNNGVKYFVSEDRPKAPGSEYQMIDDERNSDAKRGPLYQTAAFYDVLPAPADKPLKPPGEWNASRLVVRGHHVEHWLNGRKMLAYEVGSPEVKAGVARSKFKGEPGFGEKITGPLMLTYHNDECGYRNLKLRVLQ
jgi:hypothetical protein